MEVAPRYKLLTLFLLFMLFKLFFTAETVACMPIDAKIHKDIYCMEG